MSECDTERTAGQATFRKNVWYFAVLGVNTPFKFAVFVREGAAPLPCIKGDRYSDRPWGQISQNQSKNDKKGKIVQRSQLCDHLVGRRDCTGQAFLLHFVR